MAIIIKNETRFADVGLLTIFDVDNNKLIFEGTEAELTQLIIDAKNIAIAIRADLDVNDGISDNDVFDYELYKEFGRKY